MDDYAKAFIETMAWTDNYCDKRLNYPLQINLSKKIDMDGVVKSVAAGSLPSCLTVIHCRASVSGLQERSLIFCSTCKSSMR